MPFTAHPSPSYRAVGFTFGIGPLRYAVYGEPSGGLAASCKRIDRKPFAACPHAVCCLAAHFRPLGCMRHTAPLHAVSPCRFRPKPLAVQPSAVRPLTVWPCTACRVPLGSLVARIGWLVAGAG